MLTAATVKRSFDLLVSMTILLVVSPLLVVVAVLTRFKLGSPILFRQVRPGLGARPFEMLKFRSMTDARDRNGQLLADGERLTAFGRFLRASSLDELPALINVVKGDMSLVGPRPLLMQYVPLYNAHQTRRHEVKPGITGWAQVNGRNAIGWNEKFDLDVWYVDNRSFMLDMKILAMTALKVVRREGISAEGEATMAAFRGSDPPN